MFDKYNIIVNNIVMKRIICLFGVLIAFITGINSCFAISYNSINSAYTTNALMRARYYPRNMYNNRYQRMNTNRYIYTPQQARYNGFRTGINGVGYNNSYYYNRYRR